MEIRIRNTGEVMTEITFRDTFRDRVLPAQLTQEFLDGFAGGCDVVLEGAQPSAPDRYGFVYRNGVEQIEGQWFTKYSIGPVFTGPDAAADEAAYRATKDLEFGQSNSSQAKALLESTDWCENPSVRNAAVTPHLTNGAEFDTYRLALRAIVINKPATVETWPTRPEAIWA